MMLALNEIRRGRGRFAAIIGALSLIVFLVLTLAALGDGLFFGSTGAVRNTTATAYAFDKEAEGSLIRSSLKESEVAKVARADGVTKASPVGVLLGAADTPAGEQDVAVFGVAAGGAGVPTTLTEGRLPAPGEDGTAAIDQSLADAGVAIGDTVSVGPVEAEVVGIVTEANYQLQPTVWTSVTTWREMRNAVRPEFTGVTDDINAVAIEGAPGVAPTVPGLSVLTAEETGLAIPGVAQQRSTLNTIIYTALAVAALVVALFFALIVLEKRELFAALKALGTSTAKLGWGVVVQAAVATAIGIVIGAIVSRLLGMVLPEQVPTLFRTDTLITIAAFTLVAGILGAALSLRRIARIDPATAIGGAL